MAKIIREEPPKKHARQIRHTFVQGQDGKHYKVITFGLYDWEPEPEFHRFETNVQECDERGKWRVLVQPLLKRFFKQEHAEKFHDQLLQHFDQVLKLPVPKVEKKKEEPKPDEPKKEEAKKD